VGDKTGISWTDATWNPVRGCSRVSEGCRHCYAETVAARFSGPGQPYEGLADRTRKGSKWTGEVRFVAEHLQDPLHWERPRRIFVNSMSDLFHEKLTDEVIDKIFAVMILANRHTYQILTKRADRMHDYITAKGRHDAWSKQIARLPGKYRRGVGGVSDGWWPRHSNYIWLGVSVEDQSAAEERIPWLLKTPAAVRFLSCEPLLGPIDLTMTFADATCRKGLFWVIAGCESGPGARPCDIDWLRSLRDQCSKADVAFFLKQANGSVFASRADNSGAVDIGDGSKRKSRGVIELPYLDGVQHAEFPCARSI
jgi:protein gp37